MSYCHGSFSTHPQNVDVSACAGAVELKLKRSSAARRCISDRCCESVGLAARVSRGVVGDNRVTFPAGDSAEAKPCVACG